jgi:hypothetical protein
MSVIVVRVRTWWQPADTPASYSLAMSQRLEAVELAGGRCAGVDV